MLPSLLKRILENPHTDTAPQEPAEELRAAAFSGTPSSAPELWFRILLCLPLFVEQMEEAILSSWTALELDPVSLAASMNECLADVPLSRDWPPETLAQVRDYYVALFLPSTDE